MKRGSLAPAFLLLSALTACKPTFLSPSSSNSPTPSASESAGNNANGTTSASASTEAAPATQLAFTTQPSTTASAGTAFTQQPVVQLLTAGGTVASTATQSVTLAAFTNSTCTAAATGTLRTGATAGVAIAASAGVASFASVNHTAIETIYLKATSGSLTATCSAAIAVSIGAAAKVLFTTQPSSTGTAATALAQQPIVQVQDAGGNLITSATNPVTLTPFTNAACTNASTGTLSATLNPKPASAGIATFAGVQHTKAETVYLKATSAGLSSDCSTVGITISAGATSAVTSYIYGSGAILPDGVDTSVITVLLLDAGGNPKGGITPTFSATGGGNSYGGCSSSSAVTGISTCSMTSTVVGNKVLSITAPVAVGGGTVRVANQDWTTLAGTAAGTPSPRSFAGNPGVWTGAEVLIWGGRNGGATYNTGARYNPVSASWTAMAGTNAPPTRSDHCSFWSGRGMIVWGGTVSSPGNTGGIYDPWLDTWTAMPVAGAPSARTNFACGWSGRYLMVWGGSTGTNDGARFDVANSTWSPMSATGAPAAREKLSPVWSGRKLLIWGGSWASVARNDGGQYDPVLNSWTAITSTGAPSPRDQHGAVWSGGQMVVWGGSSGDSTGGRYNASTDVWYPMATIGAPSARNAPASLWVGKRALFAGGGMNDAGLYDPAADSWSQQITRLPSWGSRTDTSAIWMENKVMLWGGSDGTAYNDARVYSFAAAAPVDTWTDLPTTAGVPSARAYHVAVWTGSRMIVWGGTPDGGTSYVNTGASFDPVTMTWTPTSTAGAPETRFWAAAAWTGSHMLVWGGTGSGPGNTGGLYEPTTDTWTTMATVNAPVGRSNFYSVWTGRSFLVWGGSGGLNSGGRYDLSSNSWTAMSSIGAPIARYIYASMGGGGVWTGKRFLVWGGDGGTELNSGGLYDPETDTWSTMTTVGAPMRRNRHVTLWVPTIGKMAVLSGYNSPDLGSVVNTGGLYNPEANDWVATPITNASPGGQTGIAVWTGNHILLWGGAGSDGVARLLDPVGLTWSAASTTNVPPLKYWTSGVWTGAAGSPNGDVSRMPANRSGDRGRFITFGGWSSPTNTGATYEP